MNNHFIQDILLKSSNNLFVQFARYIVVGGIAFVVDYGALFILTEYLGFHHLLSAAIAFVLGMTVNYLMSRTWVFNGSKDANKTKEFVIFALIGVIGMVLNEAIIFIGTDFFGCHYMLSKLISTALVFVWNFCARRFILFGRNS